MRNPILITLIALLACTGLRAQVKWTATWATAVERPLAESDMPNTPLTDNALRQVIRVSIGGEKLRLQLSNELSTQPLEIRSIYIADATEGAGIDPTTATYLTFGGSRSTTLQPGQALYSDPAHYPLRPLQRLSITIHYGQTPAQATTHRGSRTHSYIMLGEATPEAEFHTVEAPEHWYSLAALEVEAPTSTRCIACIGNSITDGRGSTTDGQDRWTDALAEALEGQVAVLNLGIGGNCVISGGLSAPASERFERDILAQQGITDVVIFQGVNDIGSITDDGARTTRMLTKFYRLFASQCRERGLRVYGGTIMPFKHNPYYSPTREQARQAINRWIRTEGEFHGVIDFDEATADPTDPEALQPGLHTDWLHPNPAGYALMGRCAAQALAL